MSTKVVQLDLFRQHDDEFKKRAEKSIRGLFARYNDLEFLVLEMHKRLDKMSEDLYVPAEKKDLEHTL